MATVEKPPAISTDLLIEMQERAERASKGVRDPVDAQRACERMDRMREELRQNIGETDLAVKLIREARHLRLAPGSTDSLLNLHRRGDRRQARRTVSS